MGKPAFLIVDMQKNCQESASSQASFSTALWYINTVGDLFRKHNLPVVIIQDLEDGGPGTEGFDCVEELKIGSGDFHIHKLFSNAFWQTDLDAILKANDVDFVIIAGFAAEHCVLFTFNGARERGYKTVLLQNGIAGLDEDEVKRIQLLRPVINFKALEYFIK